MRVIESEPCVALAPVAGITEDVTSCPGYTIVRVVADTGVVLIEVKAQAALLTPEMRLWLWDFLPTTPIPLLHIIS